VHFAALIDLYRIRPPIDENTNYVNCFTSLLSSTNHTGYLLVIFTLIVCIGIIQFADMIMSIFIAICRTVFCRPKSADENTQNSAKDRMRSLENENWKAIFSYGTYLNEWEAAKWAYGFLGALIVIWGIFWGTMRREPYTNDDNIEFENISDCWDKYSNVMYWELGLFITLLVFWVITFLAAYAEKGGNNKWCGCCETITETLEDWESVFLTYYSICHVFIFVLVALLVVYLDSTLDYLKLQSVSVPNMTNTTLVGFQNFNKTITVSYNQSNVSFTTEVILDAAILQEITQVYTQNSFQTLVQQSSIGLSQHIYNSSCNDVFDHKGMFGENNEGLENWPDRKFRMFLLPLGLIIHHVNRRKDYFDILWHQNTSVRFSRKRNICATYNR
jgi:hypothetical protein